MDQFLTEALKLAKKQWTVGDVFDVADRLRASYNRGLDDAAETARDWSRQCCGGTGEGGEGYANLADVIERKTARRN
jgi:hypothetical protein